MDRAINPLPSGVKIVIRAFDEVGTALRSGGIRSIRLIDAAVIDIIGHDCRGGGRFKQKYRSRYDKSRRKQFHHQYCLV